MLANDGTDPVDKQITLLETMEVNVDDIKKKMILLEMMSTPALANLAIEAARSTNLPFFVGFSMRSLGEGDQSRLVCFTFDDISADQMLRDIDFADAGELGQCPVQRNQLDDGRRHGAGGLR